MGEYANYGGKQIKIGTCENMYYLRASQAGLIDPLPGNVNPRGAERFAIRFRFPWPDEDHFEPGGFPNYDRSAPIWGAEMPNGVDHYNVQMRSDSHVVSSIPCPHGPGPHPVKSHCGTAAVHLVQQKILQDGRLVPVMKCGACGALWRIDEPDEIANIVSCCLAITTNTGFYGEIARRICAGAGIPYPHSTEVSNDHR